MPDTTDDKQCITCNEDMPPTYPYEVCCTCANEAWDKAVDKLFAEVGIGPKGSAGKD